MGHHGCPYINGTLFICGSLTFGHSVKLVVEVVSTNWRDDYLFKFADYEMLAIQECWIVDYLGIGGRRYIGSPEQPTFTVGTLVKGEYELRRFCGDDLVVSPTFPNFSLTVNHIFGLSSTRSTDP